MLKYQEIAKKIEKKIISDGLAQGEKLPSLSQLIADYQVSKSTIVKALSNLEAKGVIYQVQGSGIFARRRKKAGYINMVENQGFTSDLDKFDLTTKVINIQLTAPSEEVMSNLQCEADAEVYHITRLRYINGQVLCLEESFYLKEVVPYLNETIVTDSIFNYLTSDLKLNIGFSDKHLHVGKLQAETAQMLGLKPADPALYMEELFYLVSGQAFDYSKTIYHYEHSQFFLQSSSV